MAKKGKDRGKLGHNAEHYANYDFKQHAPEVPMGHGSFANLPSEPIFRGFSGKTDCRSGIPNSFVTSVDLISKVGENGREFDGDDPA